MIDIPISKISSFPGLVVYQIAKGCESIISLRASSCFFINSCPRNLLRSLSIKFVRDFSKVLNSISTFKHSATLNMHSFVSLEHQIADCLASLTSYDFAKLVL